MKGHYFGGIQVRDGEPTSPKSKDEKENHHHREILTSGVVHRQTNGEQNHSDVSKDDELEVRESGHNRPEDQNRAMSEPIESPYRRQRPAKVNQIQESPQQERLIQTEPEILAKQDGRKVGNDRNAAHFLKESDGKSEDQSTRILDLGFIPDDVPPIESVMSAARVLELESFFDFGDELEYFDAILVDPGEAREYIHGFFAVTVGV